MGRIIPHQLGADLDLIVRCQHRAKEFLPERWTGERQELSEPCEKYLVRDLDLAALYSSDIGKIWKKVVLLV